MNLNLEDTKKALAGTFQRHTANIKLWIGFFTLSLLVYYFLSSGDFSFLLTYASFMRCFGFGLLNYKMWSNKSASGVSIKTLELYVLTFFFRLLSILRHQGYLPFDKTGDWFYHVVETLSFFAVVVALGALFGPFLASYTEKHDRFGNLYIPSELGALYLILPAILLAVFFTRKKIPLYKRLFLSLYSFMLFLRVFYSSNLNREFFSDTCWTLSMYLEAIAMLPQIYMFQRQAADEGGTVEPLIGHTVFALGFARVFELIFWLGSFKELTDHSGNRFPGYLVLLSQIGHLIILGDFFYYYFKSISRGLPMQLPTANYASLV